MYLYIYKTHIILQYNIIIILSYRVCTMFGFFPAYNIIMKYTYYVEDRLNSFLIKLKNMFTNFSNYVFSFFFT